MAKKKTQKKAVKSPITVWPLYVIFAVSVLLYILLQGSPFDSLFGFISLVLIIIIVAMEFVISGKQEGYRKSVIEVLIAIVIIVVLWFSLRFMLNTNDPVDVVPSCSMLPALQRGDLIVLHGVNAQSLKAPIVNVTRADFTNMLANISSEHLVCLAYRSTGNGVLLSQFEQSGYALGLFKFTGSSYELAQPGIQNNNLVRYACGYQDVRQSGNTLIKEAYTKNISINGFTINENLNNSVLVYRTVPNDYFYSIGDTYIVHRAYAVLNVSGSYYLLTKGDNNPGLDLQYGNLPINSTDIQGSTVLDIPYLGYLKIIMSGQPAEPAGCNSTVVH